jgi:LacI family transcriptional regulator
VQGMKGDQLAQSMIMRDQGVDGYCAMISGSAEERQQIVSQLRALDQPVVIFQEALENPSSEVCVVRQDDRGGGRLIADHLLARRVEDYLLIVPHQGWPAIENRVAGLREALAATAPDSRVAVLVSASESYPDVQAALADHLRENPLPGAIVGANDPIAIAAMTHLLDKGVRIPDDVRVVGFNGFEAHRYVSPSLTTVLSSPYAMGEQAGRAMLERLASGRFSAPEFVLPVVFAPHATT